MHQDTHRYAQRTIHFVLYSLVHDLVYIYIRVYVYALHICTLLDIPTYAHRAKLTICLHCRICCQKCKRCPVCRVAIEDCLPVYDVQVLTCMLFLSFSPEWKYIRLMISAIIADRILVNVKRTRIRFPEDICRSGYWCNCNGFPWCSSSLSFPIHF